MSFEAVLWAMKSAPVADAAEWAVLVAMAEAADDDGCNSYRSRPTIGDMVKVDPKTVGRRQAAMEKRGLIARGDQSVAEHIPADVRPVVWDLMIPYGWFPEIGKTNRYRLDRGRKPLTVADRPDLGEAPEKKRRADVGVERLDRRRNAGTTSPVETESPTVDAGTTSPSGTLSPGGQGLLVPDAGTASPTTLSLTQSNNSTQRSTSPNDRFDDFWAVYPRRTAKAAARKAWTSAVKATGDPDRVLAAAARFAEITRRSNTEHRFIAHPATWLNQGRYDDDELQPRPAADKPTGSAAWCGDCDQHTRLIYPDGRGSSLAAPCPVCHPFSLRKAANQ